MRAGRQPTWVKIENQNYPAAGVQYELNVAA